jgi:hypothetical protein
MRENRLLPTSIPDLQIINDIWMNKINDNDFMNFYELIIINSIKRANIYNIISSCILGVSELYLQDLLRLFNIKNNNGVYELDDWKAPSLEEIESQGFSEAQFNNTPLNQFSLDTIKQIISLWLAKTESQLTSLSKQIYCQPRIVSVFYRFIQWNISLGQDMKNQLASNIFDFLNTSSISESEKQLLISRLNYSNKKFGNVVQNSFEYLFDNDPRLINFLSNEEI